MHKRFTTIFFAGLLALGASGGAAMAQQTNPAQAAPGSTAAPAASYTDAQLKKFIDASQKVAMISQEYTPKVQTTNGEGAKKKVIQEADDKMVKAVNKEGMTVDQFNGLNQAAQHDPKLLERIQKIAAG